MHLMLSCLSANVSQPPQTTEHVGCNHEFIFSLDKFSFYVGEVSNTKLMRGNTIRHTFFHANQLHLWWSKVSGLLQAGPKFSRAEIIFYWHWVDPLKLTVAYSFWRRHKVWASEQLPQECCQNFSTKIMVRFLPREMQQLFFLTLSLQSKVSVENFFFFAV